MPKITKATSLVDVIHEVGIATETLRQKGLATVEPGFAEIIAEHLFTDKVSGHRFPKGRSTRVRRNPGLLSTLEAEAVIAPGAHTYEITNSARIVGRLLEWHQGNGDLHKLFAAKFEAGPLFDGLDTLAQTILVLSGFRSRALAAWAATGLIESPDE